MLLKIDYCSVESPPSMMLAFNLPINPYKTPISVSNLLNDSSRFEEIVLDFYISRFAFLTRLAIKNLS